MNLIEGIPMLLTGRDARTGQPVEIETAGGQIAAVRRTHSAPGDLWLAPGLIDIQINGYLGQVFGAGAEAGDAVVTAAEGLAAYGVTGFCPTVTTADFATLQASLRSIARACEESAPARTRVAGIHLEGPYISPLDGPRGAHPREQVRPPDWDELCRLQEAAGGRIRLLTLAPELPGALDVIARARARGIVVALGHHAADRATIQSAVAAGAVLCTHLGNGSHSVLPRHDNYIWEQLAHDGLQASLIVDGHHLPPAVVKSFYRVKGADRLILVSDASPVAGLPAGEYSFMGQAVDVRGDGSVRLTGTPYLAGSALRLCDAIGNLMVFAGASFSEAISLATANPARLLGLDEGRGRLQVGGRADVTAFRLHNGRPELALTVIGGQVVFESSA